MVCSFTQWSHLSWNQLTQLPFVFLAFQSHFLSFPLSRSFDVTWNQFYYVLKCNELSLLFGLSPYHLFCPSLGFLTSTGALKVYHNNWSFNCPIQYGARSSLSQCLVLRRYVSFHEDEVVVQGLAELRVLVSARTRDHFSCPRIHNFYDLNNPIFILLSSSNIGMFANGTSKTYVFLMPTELWSSLCLVYATSNCIRIRWLSL